MQKDVRWNVQVQENQTISNLYMHFRASLNFDRYFPRNIQWRPIKFVYKIFEYQKLGLIAEKSMEQTTENGCSRDPISESNPRVSLNNSIA